MDAHWVLISSIFCKIHFLTIHYQASVTVKVVLPDNFYRLMNTNVKWICISSLRPWNIPETARDESDRRAQPSCQVRTWILCPLPLTIDHPMWGSFTNELLCAPPIYCLHRPLTQAGRPITGYLRPSTQGGRPGTMEQAIKAPRTAYTARPITSSSGRFVRMGTVNFFCFPITLYY